MLSAGAILEYFALLLEGVSVVWIQFAKLNRVEVLVESTKRVCVIAVPSHSTSTPLAPRAVAGLSFSGSTHFRAAPPPATDVLVLVVATVAVVLLSDQYPIIPTYSQLHPGVVPAYSSLVAANLVRSGIRQQPLRRGETGLHGFSMAPG